MMNKRVSIVIALFVTLGVGVLAACAPPQQTGEQSSEQAGETAVAPEPQEEVKAFDQRVFSSRIEEAWNSRSGEKIAGTLSKMYNEVGLSRDEAVERVSKLFGEYEEVSVRHRVLDFKRFPGTNLGSVKAVMEIQGRMKGAEEVQPVLQTLGYASVIFEDGEWKTYATQAVASPEVAFGFDSVTAEGWPEWGTQLSMEEMRELFGSF